MTTRKTTVLNTPDNVAKYETYLSANGVGDYSKTKIENGRRVLFVYSVGGVVTAADAGVDDGNDYGDGGPTREDLGLTEGGDDGGN